MKEASRRVRSAFSLDEWLSPYVHRRALISLSLHGGMERIDEIEHYVRAKVQKWVRGNTTLAPPR
jgi:hypothetical protein